MNKTGCASAIIMLTALIFSVLAISSVTKKNEISTSSMDIKAFVNYVLQESFKKEVRGYYVKDSVVCVALNGKENVSKDWTKDGMLLDCKNLFEKMSTRDDFISIQVVEYLKLYDTYGKEYDVKAFQLEISKEKIKQIVWENFVNANLEVIADTYWLTDYFKQ